MTDRFCPECDTRTNKEVCPKCGMRTVRERRERADPLIGRVLDGRYRIESLIGRGGMGSVYKGIQIATNQVVAVKVMKSEYAEDKDAVRRFHREARAASLLTHPHTIRVFDFGQSEDGDLYMVLEYLTGRTLTKALKAEGRLSEERVAKIAREICQSLTEAHQKGLVHRDLKPDNVMLVDTVGDPDFVKVLDFGVVKMVSGSSAGESGVTKAGVVVGTPQYMSPEQAQGLRELTSAVDIYALGVLMYQALSGQRPFEGESPMEVLMAHAHKPVPELPPDCPVTPEMRVLIRSMLAKNPVARPKAVDLVDVLDQLRVAAKAGQAVVTAKKTPPVREVHALTPRPGKGPGTLRVEQEAVEPESDAVGPTMELGLPGPGTGRARLKGKVGIAIAALAAGAVVLAVVWYLAAGRKAQPEAAGGGVVAGLEVQAAGAGAMAEEVRAAEVPPEPEDHGPVQAAGVEGEGRLRVRFDSSPPGATVSMDGVVLGKTPFATEIQGPPGTRRFSFALSGYRESVVSSEVRDGGAVVARLRPAVPRPPPRPKEAPRPGPGRIFRPID